MQTLKGLKIKRCVTAYNGTHLFIKKCPTNQFPVELFSTIKASLPNLPISLSIDRCRGNRDYCLHYRPSPHTSWLRP